MLPNRAISKLLLPSCSPRRVRAAAVHAGYLAQTSVAPARSVAANSTDARIRLKAEINRLRQEIRLLCEEVRIEDARWRVSTFAGRLQSTHKFPDSSRPTEGGSTPISSRA